ncbi:restriction endonuclease subunit S [Stutzerimonas nitrititolerans]|uniref:restriction endonuclease subunit S n=1 Tax=Stutzerimonas nitrititolerans TaxID=2482751 RepID=UPI003AA80187
MSSEWRLATVEEIAAPYPTALATGPFGSAISSKYFVDSGVPVIRGANLSADTSIKLIDADLAFVSHEKAGEFQRSVAKRGDLVFTCWGTINQVGLIDGRAKFDSYIVSNKQMKLTVDSAKADHRFIYYLFSGPVKQKEILENGIGSSVPGFNLGQLKRHEFLLPPVEEQARIADFMEILGDRITLLRETNATLEAIAQALFKSWFVNFDPVRAKAEGRQPEGMDAATAALFPDSFEESELGLVPKGWGVVPFLDACDLQGGAQPPAATFIDEPRDGYVRLLQIRDFSTDAHKTYIPDTGKLKKVTEDDVLIGRYGSASGDKAKDSLGRVCRGLSGSYNVALMKLCPVQVGREYAFQMVSDSSFYRYLQGVSSKAVQSGFSKAELGQYKVIMPSSDLAEAFEQFGKAVWERVKANRELAQTLTQLRDTLLPRLISGQLRLPEAESLLEKAL